MESMYSTMFSLRSATVSVVETVKTASLFTQVFIVILVLLALMSVMLIVRSNRNFKVKVDEVKRLVGIGSTNPRFRKRDKVMFYGRKMLRKVSYISGQVKTGVRLQRPKKRQMVLKFARRLLRLRRENQNLHLQVKEPPAAYLEADYSESAEQYLPPDVLYMLQSIRIFRGFEKPLLFVELCKHLESRLVTAGQYLFKIGDQDDSIYVVQIGRLNVTLTETDGSELLLKTVCEGESVTSFLSFIDIMAGCSSTYKTVSARAEVDTIVLRLPMCAFQDMFDRFPETLVRVVQIIMLRLHRVSFTALYQYLGLTAQLINPSSPIRRTHSLPGTHHSHSSKQSPMKGSDSCATPDERSSQDATDSDIDPARPCKECNENESQNKGSAHPPATPGDFARRRRRSHLDLLEGRQLPVDKEVDYLKQATSGFMQHLGLVDDSLLNGRIELRDVAMGTYLIRQESLQDAALIFPLAGTLIVSQKLIDKEEEAFLFVAYPGELVGGLAVLSGEPSFFTVRARSASRVAIINKNNFYAIMREVPKIVLHVATSIIQRLSRFVRQIDFALDWKHIESGKALYRQGDSSDCMYIVLSGRLRSVISHCTGKKELVGEYGKGDLVGIVELLTHTPRSTTVMAVRDTELAIMPEGLLNTIKIKYPVVVTRLVHLLGHRILGSWQRGSVVEKVDSRPSASNFSTVAILPVTDDVPLAPFTMELYHSALAIRTTLCLTSDQIKKSLGPSALDRNNEFRLSSWLGQQEDQYRLVLYQCDDGLTPWTLRCIRQADVILIVALADQEPTVGKIEKQLESLAIRTQKELVLLHKEGEQRPSNTVLWLNMRSWCSSHHHICCPKRMFTRKSQLRMMEMYRKRMENEPSIHSDFSRLARFLTGTSIGLVLGGGGARGCAHIGMIRAITEAGIPIDMVGGVSIGAFMGALWCMEKNVTTVTQLAREWSRKMTSVWRQIVDLTYPAAAMFTGAGFNKTIREAFNDTRIEDLWLPYFTITTDITNSSMRVHTHGSLWRYVRASMSLSGYIPPLCDPIDGHLLLDGGYINNLPGSLWRYVRASMSICGLLPPLCDPEDGHLLVDGAYVHNLPADVMHNMGARTVLAIDVGSQDDMDLTNYGDELSGWWLLWKRWNPWAHPVKVPSLPEIQSRLAYVSCVRQFEEVRSSDYCRYIRPPIDCYKTLQFGSFDEIKDVGYMFGKSFFALMKKEGDLPGLCREENVQRPIPKPQAWTSFTDLAEMVCRIQPSKPSTLPSDFSDEEEYDEDAKEDGYASEPATSSKILEEQLEDDCQSSTRRRRRNSLSETDCAT